MADDLRAANLRAANLPLRSKGPPTDRFGVVTSATDAATPPDVARALSTDGFYIPRAKRAKSRPAAQAQPADATLTASIPAEVTVADTAALASMGLSLPCAGAKGLFYDTHRLLLHVQDLLHLSVPILAHR